MAMASSLSLIAVCSCSLGSRTSAMVLILSLSSRREHISTESSAICRSHGDHDTHSNVFMGHPVTYVFITLRVDVYET